MKILCTFIDLYILYENVYIDIYIDRYFFNIATNYFKNSCLTHPMILRILHIPMFLFQVSGRVLEGLESGRILFY